MPQSLSRVVRFLIFSAAFWVFLLAPLGTPAAAQTPDCVEGCSGDSAPPEISLAAPPGEVFVANPLIKVEWCDTQSLLDGASRWIKVNGVVRTSSFDYVTGGPIDCAGRKTSSSTTVTLSLGSNDVSAHICDVVGNCRTASFTVDYVAPGASIVIVKNLNPDNQNRGLCLTTGGGEATAVQCGDLLVADGMPGYQTMGRDRSLTLLYNSATAAPRPTVAAWVTLPTTVAQPDSVYAELQISGIKRASAWFTAWGGTNRVRQIVLAAPFDTVSGVYPFTLVVRNQYATGAYDTTQTGSLIVVNRRTSEFGAGWWLAGAEQLITAQAGNKILWVGGDGSAAVYDSIGPGVWRRALGGFRDSLVRFDSSGTWYRRTLRHRVTVTFSSAGKHVRTTNRLQHSTSFLWTGPAFDTLKTITVPPAGQSATTYTLAYVAGTRILDKITDPAGRILDATITSGNLIGLTDPDGVGVSFVYDGTRRLTNRTNRRGYTTNYVYANGLRVTRVEVPLSSQADLAQTNITHWDEQGLAVGNVSGRLTPADTSLVYTQVDGPRTDVADIAKFWVDRWGAPVKMRDPLGYETLLSRSDANNPALVTRAQFADTRIVGAAYDGRGNLVSTSDSTYDGTGTTQTVTTSYVYGNSSVRDSPTLIRTPVDTTRVTYDTALGLPDTAIAPGGHRTRFEYHSAAANKGLLYRVVEVSVTVVDTTNWLKSPAPTLTTTFTYDSWGNDSIVTSPKGIQNRHERDAYRRVIRAIDGMSHQAVYAYDSLNRPRSVSVTDPGTLTTRYFYSLNSAVDSVLDPRSVKRSWDYDAADRSVSLRDEAQVADQRFLNRAGLLDSMVTRNANLIRYRYDAAGQVTATIYPRRGYEGFGYPATDTVPGDSLSLAYDAMRRLVVASRARSTITRTYNREGTLRSERQVARDTAGSVISDITMRYWYDLGGRRVKFLNGTDTVRYTYGSNGLLSTLAVQWMPNGSFPSVSPDTFRFYWDGLGRRDSVVYPMGAYVTFGYDADGLLRMVCSRHEGNPADKDFLEHRLWYDKTNADGMVTYFRHYAGGVATSSCGSFGLYATQLELDTLQYDARHQIVENATRHYDYDASGNRVAVRNLSGGLLDSLSFQAGRSRLYQRFTQDRQLWKTYAHFGDGARASESSVAVPGGFERLYYYNAVGEMTGHRWVYGVGYNPVPGYYYPLWAGGPTRCTYDALGRRTNSCGGSSGLLGFDGDNVVRSEQVGYGYARWRYVHGPGLDDPLVAVHPVGSDQPKYYYLTDGRGRHLAFTDSTGTNFMEPASYGGPEYSRYYQEGGNQAGSIENSHGFENVRGGSDDTPQISYHRNRYYDQQTGRFINEDPIDIAGGANLYQFTGNNPVNFSDPFGLKPCPGRLDKMQKRLERLALRIQQYRRSAQRGIADRDHLDQIEGEKDGLNNDLDKYHRDGCDDDDNDFRRTRNQASSLSRVKLPQPQMRYGPQQMMMADGMCSADGVQWTYCGFEGQLFLPGVGLAPGSVLVFPRVPVFSPTPGLVPAFGIIP